MASVPLQPTLWFLITAIQLTSSQSTYDVVRRDDDVRCYERTGLVLGRLNQLQNTALEMHKSNSQLLRDVAELKAAIEVKCESIIIVFSK